ncbi:hypothetical protein HBI17_203330 [Parastagonospora nodorum]|nr:hypothetical protein HBI17_203330 [Parastagonospora nodorum]
MAIIENFEVPKSAQDLPLATEANIPFFILFLASIDPATNQSWCSDVRASLPLLNRIFSDPSGPVVHYTYVGSRAEYKEVPGSRFRSDWDIPYVPTLVRYERTDGSVKEISRLVEGELLNEVQVRSLIAI